MPRMSFWSIPFTKYHKLHCTENRIHVFPEKEMRGLRTQFLHSPVCERFIYFEDQSMHIFGYSKIERPILEIYKSHTDI